MPDSTLDLATLSEKDLRDLQFVLEEGGDFVGLSISSQTCNFPFMPYRPEPKGSCYILVEISHAMSIRGCLNKSL